MTTEMTATSPFRPSKAFVALAKAHGVTLLRRYVGEFTDKTMGGWAEYVFPNSRLSVYVEYAVDGTVKYATINRKYVTGRYPINKKRYATEVEALNGVIAMEGR